MSSTIFKLGKPSEKSDWDKLSLKQKYHISGYINQSITDFPNNYSIRIYPDNQESTSFLSCWKSTSK